FVFYVLHRTPPCSTLFPYTTLFRSPDQEEARHPGGHEVVRVPGGAGGAGDDALEEQCGHRHEAGVVQRVRDVSSCQRARGPEGADRKSTRLNSSHVAISYAVFCLKK